MTESEIRAHAEREAYRQRLDALQASRDAGRSLTSDALAGGIDLHAIVSSAISVADFTDEAIAIVREEYRPVLQCREGCAYCCRKPGVLVTIPDLLRILSTVRARFDVSAMSALTVRAKQYTSAIEGRDFNAPTDQSVPCPLLIDERCSVYDVRPLVCRGYNSTSADACRAAHHDMRHVVPIFSIMKDVTDGAAIGVTQSLREVGVNDAMVDLGSALHAVLDADERFAEGIVAGSSDYAHVENATWARDLWARVQSTARELGRHEQET